MHANKQNPIDIEAGDIGAAVGLRYIKLEIHCVKNTQLFLSQ
jgi:hypothetical protein